MECSQVNESYVNPALWWMSLDLYADSKKRKNYPKVIELIEQAKRYDLVLETGDILSRAIFDSRIEHLHLLLPILGFIKNWPEAVIHVNGEPIGEIQIHVLMKLITCTLNQPHCLNEDKIKRYKFIGCHRPFIRIGLLHWYAGCSDRFWFSFFKPDEHGSKRFIFNIDAFQSVYSRSRLCPYHQPSCDHILQSLPLEINPEVSRSIFQIKRLPDIFHNQNQTCPPSLIPVSQNGYNKWIKERLKGFINE